MKNYNTKMLSATIADELGDLIDEIITFALEDDDEKRDYASEHGEFFEELGVQLWNDVPLFVYLGIDVNRCRLTAVLGRFLPNFSVEVMDVIASVFGQPTGGDCFWQAPGINVLISEVSPADGYRNLVIKYTSEEGTGEEDEVKHDPR